MANSLEHLFVWKNKIIRSVVDFGRGENVVVVSSVEFEFRLFTTIFNR